MQPPKVSSEFFRKYNEFYPYNNEVNQALLTDSEELISYYSAMTDSFWTVSSFLRFSDLSDYILKYNDGTHCIPISPNVEDLLLLSYCTAKLYDSLGSATEFNVSSYIGSLFREQHKLIKERRKIKHFLEANFNDDLYSKKCRKSKDSLNKDCDDAYYSWASFAENAKRSLFFRSLHFRKNDYSQMFHPYNQGIYFQPANSGENDVEFTNTPQIPFSLEDYFFYEYCNGGSLAVELTACLLQISDKSTADCVLQELVHKLPSFIHSPMIYSRIAVARLYITEAYGEIRYQEKYRAFISDEAKVKCIHTAFDRVDKAVQGLLYCLGDYVEESYYSIKYKEPLPTTDSIINNLSPDGQPRCSSTPSQNQRKISILKGNDVVQTFVSPAPDSLTHEKVIIPKFVPATIFHCDRSNLDTYLTKLEHNLSHICNPISIMKYLCNPVYGPVAFCNQEHPKVTALLEKIKYGRNHYTTDRKHAKGKAEIMLRNVQASIWNADILDQNTELWTHTEDYIEEIEKLVFNKPT